MICDKAPTMEGTADAQPTAEMYEVQRKVDIRVKKREQRTRRRLARQRRYHGR